MVRRVSTHRSSRVSRYSRFYSLPRRIHPIILHRRVHYRRLSQPIQLIQYAMDREVGDKVVSVLLLALGEGGGVHAEGRGFGEGVVDLSDSVRGGEDVTEAGRQLSCTAEERDDRGVRGGGSR
jgi:hypothetical protein